HILRTRGTVQQHQHRRSSKICDITSLAADSVTFGFASDAVGRKRCYVTYLATAAVLMLLYGAARSPILLLALGPLVAFFGTGYYSGFGAVTAEIYPTRIRATGLGFTYNTGRIASAAAPFLVGSLAQ